MDLRLLSFLLNLVLVFLVLSSAQDTNEEIPEGASTLAFVFDVTGSMYDDLVQVIEGASKILETSLSRPKRPLYNFALVPFHDPEIGPITITTDPKKFQDELRELYVQGGGDCPEMSIGAIKIALEISQPGSYIYVFTDARSKDYRLTHEVLQLIQQKQSQVVFVLTGDCDDRSHVGYKVYEEIASTSSGQVFHLDKKQVNEVLKWVEEAVQSSKVHLLSTDHQLGLVNSWQIPFDPSLKEVTVALSGPAPNIEIRNSQGKLIGIKEGLSELLHIPNSAKVLNLKDPAPGMWTIKTSSEGRHSVRISGLSNIDFRAGFSRKHTLDFKMTSSRPVQGIPTFVLLNTTGLSPPARADRLELMSITGNVMKTLPIRYYPERRPYGIWNITEFVPPKEAFFLRVTGYDRDGFVFQRVSSVSYSSIVPDAPKVSMPTHTPGYYLQKGSITCYVDSLIPYTLRFTREGLRLGVDQLFRESSNASWEITEVTLKDEGFYECIAISSAGTGRAQTFLDVSEPPPAITVPYNVTSYLGANAVLTCIVASTVRFNLTWQRGHVDARLDQRMRVTANLSLEVQRVAPDDAGWYTCIAANEGGISSSRLYLHVQEPPVVTVDPWNQTFRSGQEVGIRCSAKGYPAPMVVWTHNDMFIMGSSRHRMTLDGTLVIRNMEPKDAGTYGCLASNIAGTDTQTSILTYIESPQVTVPHAEMLIGLGQTVVLECRVTGVPHPDVIWYKDDVQLRSSAFLSVDPQRGTLSIQKAQDKHAGDYTCVAVNTAGSAQGYITLDVGSAPQFTRKPSDLSADIGTNVTLPCHAQGHPEPQLSWRREDNVALFSKHRGHSTITQKSGHLFITNLWVEDEAIYVCEAQNQFGKIQSKAKVTVTGLVSPMIALSPAVVSVIEDQQVTLPCVLLAGNPLPERHWLHDNGLVESSPYVTVRLDGSLHIERVNQQDGGQYTCLAENVVGSSNRTTIVNVYVMPTIQHGPQIFSTIEGTPISLPCRAHGVPKPDVTWSKRGEMLDLSGSAFSLDEDGSLHIFSPSGEESAEFVCTATNAAGYSSRKVQLTVYVRPRPSSGGGAGIKSNLDELLEMSVTVGDDVTLPCEVKSVPPPIITWAKDKQLISPFSPRHVQLSSGSMTITETRVTDSGIYVCVATNIAGNFTQTVKLSVLVPPSIRAGPRTIKVQVGHPIELPCIAHGVPEPSISWLKDGAALLDGSDYRISDGSLILSQVGLIDEGTYTCVASNIAGQDETNIQLQVQVPPVVEVLEPPFNSPLQERVANQQIAFPCPAKGTPEPVIKWLRNGQDLTGNEPGVSILEDGTLLILASVSPLDNGEYTCMAVNDAGTTEKKYQLKVNVPPDIRDSGLLSNVSVAMNQPTNLVCDVTGTPVPVITWYKDGVVVTSNSNVQILQKGKTLKFLKAAVSDAGRYTCKAINIAGSTERDLNLDVLVPPTIIGTVGSRDISGILNQEIVLECRVKGDPFPTIQWYKDRKPVFLVDPNIEVSNRGQQLKIKSARLGDQARYQCSATNSAGKQSKEFNLSIFVPPSIKGGNVSSELTVLLGNTLTLECEVRGVPLPAITWYKNGKTILSSRQAQYVERGQFLKISRAQVSDAGQYTCKVTSVAGTAEKLYELDVYVPPSITGNSDGSTDVKVVLSKSLMLTCEAEGHPPPSLTWLKDGSPVTAKDNLRVLEQGRKIEIISALPSDAGRYACVATSVAGEKEIKYDVSVLVPPVVDGASDTTDATVIINNILELECHAIGTPTPTITWLKDGLPVRQGEGVRITSNGRRLVVSRAQLSDTAVFLCVATNEAGEQEREFKVSVHVPPNIRSTGPSDRSVVLQTPISLQCVASGVPPPSITWLKDGRPVDTTGEFLKLESAGRVLQIKMSRLEDAGKYTCVATNAAGEAQQHIRLNVHEPPSIQNAGEILNETILAGFQIQLKCKATGSPLPAVTWYKDGRPLTSAAGVNILSRGQVLEIDRAQVSDAGLYKCVAINVAGSTELTHSLQVYVPPSISSKGGMITVVVNDPIRLECEASGLPVPSLTWLKDGSPVSSFSDGIQILSGGRILSFVSAQVGDTGHYTCVAVNAGGEQHREYELRVYVPPNIMGEEVNNTVLIGQAVQLHCQSDAIPPPALSWRKDGRPLYRKPGLSLSEDQSYLKIDSAQVQDTGRYTCEATNVAGKTEKNYNLNVWVPPSIRGSDEVSPLTVIEGSHITLVCESSGIPPPSLTWKKDGSELQGDSRVRILSGGRQLQISCAERTDASSYTCLASSAAGSAMKEYSLQVYVRPSISSSTQSLHEKIVTRGGDVTLQCEADGLPRPAISWLKDGRPLTGRRAQILNEGRLLRIRVAQVADTGRYTCIAVNVAGQADRKYDVNVHVPPTIIGQTQVPENVSVVVKNPVVLTCEASGMPPPAITWLKDGQPLNMSSSVRVISGGRGLRLMHAASEDAGRYTCIVSNSAGEERKNFDLNVLVPPSIINEGTVENVKVKENQNVIFACEVTGNPVPEITWLKDGQPLAGDARLQVMSNGRFLQISGSQVADTGRYSCLASNSAGDRSRHFNLNVLVSPTIAGSDPEGLAEEVTVTLNSPTSLICEAQSYPPAIITWLKDGTPFESSRNVRVLPGGRTLQILNAKEEDAGRYTCVATNEAGETLKNYEVKVFVPPVINKNDIPGESLAPKEVKIKVNNTLTLECEAQAVPTPTLVWYKDGQMLKGDGHIAITANGRIVQIKHTQVSDTGRYTCVATNIAGEDEKDFDVNIQVPPSFRGSGDSDSGNNGDVKDVILNNHISLYCETNAVPPPMLTWYKDGHLLSSNDKVLILPGGRVLQIPRAQEEDSGRYTCVAVNDAGEDSIQYDVRVLVPPSIRGADGDLPNDVTVLVNKTTLLECQVDGSPAPKISWIKDSQPVAQDSTHRLLSNGRTLQILNAQVTDTGRYVCVAQNLAGAAEKYFNLHVHVTPSIVGAREENVTVVVNNFISLSCEATGLPPPTLSWFKDRRPVQASTNTLIMPGGRTLQILKAKMSDGGKYSCVAINPAGEAQKLIHLTVYVPPSIRHNGGDFPVVLNVRAGKSATLECESNAVPPPIITWFKNGRLVTETTNLRILADGQMLQLRETEVSDTGQYVCKATNVAGQVDKNFHLNIHVPPKLDGPAVERVTETLSNPVIFACDATGIPPPSLTWLKNGRVIENLESLEMHILSGGSKLQIARSQLSDSGTYTCVASNVEGKARKNYHLTIQVPPNIAGSELPSEMSVLLNDSIQLVCRAEGTPTPEIQWLKDGKTLSRTAQSNIKISPDGSTLTVTAVHKSDNGKYTCVATNQAGEEDRIFNLNVYVPPLIQGNGPEAKELTAVLDSSINMECVASGSPPPQLNWLKNGLPLPVSSQIRLLSAGQVLRIARAQVSDGGTYTCVASNRAGVDNRYYNLQVHVPPSLDGAGSTEEVTVVKGNLATFICLVDGTPSPTITWLRNDAALPKDSQLSLTNQNSTLQISLARVDHTGRYTCNARNQAGDASRHFSLKVLDPPRINGSGAATEVSAVVNHILELVCEAEGIPVPTLTWLKDGRPLPLTDSIRLLRDGEVLRVASAQVENTGRYTCLASSPAGDDDKEFLVRVHVPPNIAGDRGVQDVSVLKNRQVTLECKSDAVPPPALSWLKDGALLKVSPRVRVLSSGRYLQINNAELGDAAQYTCVASNVAGETRRHFNLSVNVPPTIKDGPQSVWVHVNQEVVLECAVNGVPAPRITWRKGGSILAGNNPKYRFGVDGSLRILSAQVTDTGRYLCMATNQAGTERKRVDLQVYVPPSIAKGPTNITVTVNVQTTLSCEATGIPKPSVSWTKNTQALNTDQNQNMYRLLSSGSLVVIAPTVDDTAVYECDVSNEAGQESRAIQLTVHVPPSIADEVTELVVSRLSPVVIGCTASGVPHPTLYWSKDGLRLAENGEGYTILPSGPLEITTAQLSHSGRYTCVAKNAAGTAHRHVQLTVHDPPVIQSHPSTLDVILNNHVTLPCRATGSPRPTITWQKEGINIFTTGGVLTVLPNGGLQISKAKVEDSGTYMCVAQNPAGTALGKTKLRVQVPPIITSDIRSYTVALDASVTLQCHSEGFPTPSITWYKDGKPLNESVRQRVLSTGALQVAFAQPGDMGRYTCTAANVAGSISLVMSLTVQIPPSIRSGESEVSVVENTQALLSCVAEGVPQPTITWEKDGIPITDTTGEYTILPTGELLIDAAQPEDSGSYTCVGTNFVGQDSRTVDLSVHTHPVFTELLGDVALNKGERLLLTCGVLGIPPPKITWAFNNIIIPVQYDHVNGHSELVIERVSKDDSGTYSCVAENSVASIKSLGFVYVKEPPIIDGDVHSNRIEPLGGNAILNCEVRGDPLPTIRWSKTGISVPISNRIRQLDNGSLAIYGTVSEDAGNYMCVATNDAGVVERTVTLTLQSSPTITVEPVETVVDAGATVMLNCQAEGEPVPVIEWSRQERPLLGNERITTLNNGSLRISSAQKEDTAEYECVARNLLGSVLVRVSITVRVHGGNSEWMEWGACSVSCGTGVQRRLRQCTKPLPANGGRHCSGSASETRNCKGKPCPVDGNWSEWSSWEECSRTCSQGNRTRVRTCSNPHAQHGGRACEGKAVEAIMCSIRPCPVAGNWGAWLPWSPCSETCGKGMQTRLRLCNNPPPSFNGPTCEGLDTQTQVCNERNCPVDGKWSSWVSWGACSVSCGGGTRQRTRVCASPAPQHGGRQCEGNDIHIDFCNSEPCPVHGNWGPWNSWGSCSRTCNGGQMRRYRTCDNPRPANGGRACTGSDAQIQKCNTASCPVDGKWSSWESWSECSASCGGGERTRVRLCNNPSPSNNGRLCPGDSSQLSRCNIQPCPGGPQTARGSIIGNINDVEFGIAILNATISSSSTGGRIIQATITNIPRSLGPAMRKLISILNPIYWTTAHELGEAVNGYTLTNGIFRRETQVEFATGEILRMTHVARGLDTDGALLLDIVVNGHILQLPSNADIGLKDYTEDYIQTGAGQVYALSTRMFSIDRVSVPYSWNHTITYDPSRGKMPYLVETLHASAISAFYHPLEEKLEFSIHATIAKGERSNQCPSGFQLDPAGPYCADENECSEGNPCSHACHNAIGTYYCSCPRGLTISADGRTCQDIDECALGGHMCHDGQDCENTIGSYRCVMRCGRGFRRTADGLSCSDVNECQESNPCHQHCLNTIGSFRCACEPGYQLRNRRCIDINECRQRVCRSDQQCKNTRGGYTCIDLCPTGMTKGGNGTCIDIDECHDGTHQCRYNQICENTRGSYHCTCPRGYRSQGVGRPCLDINECEMVPVPCAYRCVNSPGSYKCLCPPGLHLLGDGKSCAGLERLPGYESFLYGYRTSQSSSDRSSYQQRYHSMASQSYHSYVPIRESYPANRPHSNLSRGRRETNTCPPGFRAVKGWCLDINECEQRDTCQHECMNTPGSHRCSCPNGYRLMTNGKTCQDVDECLEQNIQCGANRMCFNMRGSYQCIDTPCPPNYQRDPTTGFCLKNCPPNDLECALSPYALEYKLLSLPFGIAANQDLIRLVAYTQDGVVHPRTSFLVVDEDTSLPFALRDENLKGVLFTTRPLREPHTYRMKVRALSYSADGGIEYQTTFIVYIAVSAYPY
ncbi:hemicentin-1 isoform X1 [Triplophysa rosa]|uniref:Hemicentin-1 n=1 Tax=Triplophysa rosa TaxID=992332 RepID=A0A9W7TIN3_TRIRA|nr:hemicentin-1 isoform X1 [Triplophysa rosa]KAI7799480.1 putative hemicentin-1 [Triplophysa rosa]